MMQQQQINHENNNGTMPLNMSDQIHCEVRAMIGRSRLTRNSNGMVLVHRHELHLQELLGRGAFSEVHEVKIVPGPGRENNLTTVSQQHHTISYAMKHVKARLLTQIDSFRLAAAELAVEAHMLASFDHPNIMKIRGWAANGVSSYADGCHDSFFLLLDKLDETLDNRIITWQRMLEHEYIAKQQLEQQLIQYRQQQNRSSRHSPLAHLSENEILDDPRLRLQMRQSIHRGGTISDDNPELVAYQQFHEQHLHRYESLQLEKFGICVEIAAALAYLHDVGVIFRDLKPNNIGFLNGRVQLFDFGLSRELPALSLETPFAMSGKVGTLRYMAVEIASHTSYNVSSDVYSWAMVCYEIFTLQKPFNGWTREEHTNLVCGRGARPNFPSCNTITEQVVPPTVKQLLELSWHQHAIHRPSMKVVEHKIRLLEEQQLFTVCALDRTKNNLFASQSFNVQHLPSFTPMQIQIMRQQQQVKQLQLYNNCGHSSIVELPQNFAADACVRKPLNRNHSESHATGSTAALSSLSTESIDFAMRYD